MRLRHQLPRHGEALHAVLDELEIGRVGQLGICSLRLLPNGQRAEHVEGQPRDELVEAVFVRWRTLRGELRGLCDGRQILFGSRGAKEIFGERMPVFMPILAVQHNLLGRVVAGSLMIAKEGPGGLRCPRRILAFNLEDLQILSRVTNDDMAPQTRQVEAVDVSELAVVARVNLAEVRVVQLAATFQKIRKRSYKRPVRGPRHLRQGPRDRARGAQQHRPSRRTRLESEHH
mmetsp:Transcript_10081/g.25830  ORF Transcript_10081/g.25830 Transcript_10081/m.25830 type:complete len:231 (-) Transcript_10081:37-729(-)